MSRTFQDYAFNWARRCFGEAAVSDTNVRAARFLEEAGEMCQAVGLTETQALQVIKYVYARPIGAPFQEAGGVMMTFAVLCARLHINMEQAGMEELLRCHQEFDKIAAKHLNKPKFGVLPA